MFLDIVLLTPNHPITTLKSHISSQPTLTFLVFRSFSTEYSLCCKASWEWVLPLYAHDLPGIPLLRETLPSLSIFLPLCPSLPPSLSLLVPLFLARIKSRKANHRKQEEKSYLAQLSARSNF